MPSRDKFAPKRHLYPFTNPGGPRSVMPITVRCTMGHEPKAQNFHRLKGFQQTEACGISVRIAARIIRLGVLRCLVNSAFLKFC